jgi:hypothetical protein
VLRRRLGTRSLPPQVPVFVICQFVPKPCDKLSRIGLDSWGCWAGFPLTVRTALIKLANTSIILNSGGGATPDKPEVFLETPLDLNRVNSYLICV